jgi:hypothetical protein
MDIYVRYKISDKGNCNECKSRIVKYMNHEYCLPFEKKLHKSTRGKIRQCEECRDYLEKNNDHNNQNLEIKWRWLLIF